MTIQNPPLILPEKGDRLLNVNNCRIIKSYVVFSPEIFDTASQIKRKSEMKHLLILIFLLFTVNLLSAQTPGTVKWTFSTDDEIFGSPAIAADGTIYVGSHDHYLYAINADGTEKWKIDVGYSIKASPAIGQDGTVYIATTGIGIVWAVNPDGTKKWEVSADGWVEDTPAIADDGTIIFGTTNQNFYGINPDGSTKWTVALGWNEYSSPAIASDGTIYVGLNSGGLYARNADGTEKWIFSDAGVIKSSPAIGADGTIYVGSEDKKVYAINPDGTEKWNFSTGDIVIASPAIGADGTIYIGSYDNKFYALNPDGSEKWHFETLGAFYINDIPSIDSDNTVYITGYDRLYGYTKKLYALNSDGSLKWQLDSDDLFQGSGAIVADGTLYLGTYSGPLYAIYTGSNGLANSAWPRFSHDNRGTANTGTATSIKQIREQVPSDFSVSEAYPNPFNPGTRIQFSISQNSHINIAVYNMAGQLVEQLADEEKSAGSYEVHWNASAFASGVYFIQVAAENFIQTRKAILVK